MTLPFWQKRIGATIAVFFGNVHQLITRLVDANTLKIVVQTPESFLCR